MLSQPNRLTSLSSLHVRALFVSIFSLSLDAKMQGDSSAE